MLETTNTPPRSRPATELTRRAFLQATAAGTGVLLAIDPSPAAELGAELPTHRFRVVRDVDLLALEFSFVNFDVHGEQLCARGFGQSLVIVRFPGQNLAEAVFDEPPNESEFEIGRLTEPEADQGRYSPRPPLASFMSGPSWIVFVADDRVRLPLTDQAAERFDYDRWADAIGGRSERRGSAVDCWLRAMSEWKIRVPRNATQPMAPTMPRADETCLEIPFRLFISPTTGDTRWLTSSERWPLDRSRANVHELWHAALLSNQFQKPAGLPPGMNNIPPELAPPTRISIQAKAVFSPDYRRTGQPDNRLYYPGNMQLSLHALTRHLLVKQMAEGNGWIDAEHLILSALGSDASLSYTTGKSYRQIIEEQLHAQDDPGTELAIWKHRIVVGRDTFFIEAFYGFLFPFVHPAIYVELTKRKFAARVLEGCKHGPPAAYLLKEYFILVLDPLRQFTSSESPLGRAMPFKKVKLDQLRSPLLQPPKGIVNDLAKPGDLQAIQDESGISPEGRRRGHWERRCANGRRRARRKLSTTCSRFYKRNGITLPRLWTMH